MIKLKILIYNTVALSLLYIRKNVRINRKSEVEKYFLAPKPSRNKKSMSVPKMSRKIKYRPAVFIFFFKYRNVHNLPFPLKNIELR